MKNIERLTNTELFSELFKQLDEIKQELKRIQGGNTLTQDLQHKEILNFKETAKFLDVSHSHLYKLTSQGKIPHYKPQGKRIYFDLKMLENWLRQNYRMPLEERIMSLKIGKKRF